MAQDKARKVAGVRIDEAYLQSQVNGIRQMETHRDHKQQIEDFDMAYRGEFSKMSLFEGEVFPAQPLVENTLKNAVHDIARLAGEAKGTPMFPRRGEGAAELKKQNVRNTIAQTLWQMADGPSMESNLYMDLEVAGMAGVAVYFNDESEYPQLMRLDPRYMYPDVVNGHLNNLAYMETMKERHAAYLWPKLGLNGDPGNTAEVVSCIYYDKDVVIQSITRGNSGAEQRTDIVSTWKHGLKCVPVAYVQLPSADGRWHGYFDQLAGPLLVRNKTVALLVDYLESMVNAPFEEKGVLNATDEPSPTTVYHHDPNAEFQTFIRRVAPASPSGGVFGLLQYMDAQESQEAMQPPARVGVVSQSIASGSFVASTQGTLSSVVKELQERMALLRKLINYISFEVDAKHLDHEKPLYQAVGRKVTYTPSTDMGEYTTHTIEFGAAAGLNRSEADNRIAMHLTQRLIDKQTARQQLDYIEDISTVQDRIDEENLQDAFFQRFAADPNTPQSVMAQVLIDMNKGDSFVEALTKAQPALLQHEQAQQTPPTPGQVGPTDVTAPDQGQGLGGGGSIQPALPVAPTNQVVTRNPVF